MTQRSSRNLNNQLVLSAIEVDVTVLEGRNLTAKDRKLFRKKRTSNCFVIFTLGGKEIGRTTVVHRSISPYWSQSFSVALKEKEANKFIRGDQQLGRLQFHICHRESNGSIVPMGTVTFDLPIMSLPASTWYKVENGTGDHFCSDASGELQIRTAVSARKMTLMTPGNSVFIRGGCLRVALGWEVSHEASVHLDSSCVAIDSAGNVLLDESVYYGNSKNSNSSLRLSGKDQKAADTKDGSGGDYNEKIDMHLEYIPANVRALYFILTVASPGKTFSSVKSVYAHIYNISEREPIGRLTPYLDEDHSAVFLMRISRNVTYYGWNISIIGETDKTGRDFGSLIPEIKSYSRDIVPGIRVGLNDRIALMRKGGVIRLADYTLTKTIPEVVIMGISWEIAKGYQKIDLDVSAVCFDVNCIEVDMVHIQKLLSDDASIIHSGDEKSCVNARDNKRITVDLTKVNEYISHIVFVLNSFSDHTMNAVSRASCHLFDPSTFRDLAKYALLNTEHIKNSSSLTLCALSRNPNHGWLLRIISHPGHARNARDIIALTQDYLLRYPIQAPILPPDPDIVITTMPVEVACEEEEILVTPNDFARSLHPIAENPSSSNGQSEHQNNTVGAYVPSIFNNETIPAITATATAVTSRTVFNGSTTEFSFDSSSLSGDVSNNLRANVGSEPLATTIQSARPIPLVQASSVGEHPNPMDRTFSHDPSVTNTEGLTRVLSRQSSGSSNRSRRIRNTNSCQNIIPCRIENLSSMTINNNSTRGTSFYSDIMDTESFSLRNDPSQQQYNITSSRIEPPPRHSAGKQEISSNQNSPNDAPNYGQDLTIENDDTFMTNDQDEDESKDKKPSSQMLPSPTTGGHVGEDVYIPSYSNNPVENLLASVTSGDIYVRRTRIEG